MDQINIGRSSHYDNYVVTRWSFSLNFLPVRGLKFSGGLLRNLRVSLAARHFFVWCSLTIGARTSGRKLSENDQRVMSD